MLGSFSAFHKNSLDCCFMSVTHLKYLRGIYFTWKWMTRRNSLPFLLCTKRKIFISLDVLYLIRWWKGQLLHFLWEILQKKHTKDPLFTWWNVYHHECWFLDAQALPGSKNKPLINFILSALTFFSICPIQYVFFSPPLLWRALRCWFPTFADVDDFADVKSDLAFTSLCLWSVDKTTCQPQFWDNTHVTSLHYPHLFAFFIPIFSCISKFFSMFVKDILWAVWDISIKTLLLSFNNMSGPIFQITPSLQYPPYL